MDTFLSISPFWIWLALACILLAVEVLLAPSGVLLCIATAAGIVAALTFLVPALPWLWSSFIFALLTGIACYGWWKFIHIKRAERVPGQPGLNVRGENLVGYKATLATPIKDGKGRIKVNDASWPIVADADYPAGSKVEVVAVEGITLRVKMAGN